MRITLVGLMLVICADGVFAQRSDRIPTSGGDIVITPVIHASVQIEHDDLVIHVDPWSAADLSTLKPADLILVTDSPGHHLDPDAIEFLAKSGAPVVITSAGKDAWPDGTVLANGESGVFAGVEVEAIPAYDLTPGRPFHPKGDANGYLVTLGGQRILLAGVTQCVPEIQVLSDIAVAFLPMNLPVDRMRPIAVAECLKTFTPQIVYLYHYDQRYASWLGAPKGTPPVDIQDTPATIRAFQAAIEGLSIDFRDHRWYPER